jgi:hypothetical protein
LARLRGGWDELGERVMLLVLVGPKDPSGVDLVPLGAFRGQAPPLPEVCKSGLHFLISFPILRQPLRPS